MQTCSGTAAYRQSAANCRAQCTCKKLRMHVPVGLLDGLLSAQPLHARDSRMVMLLDIHILQLQLLACFHKHALPRRPWGGLQRRRGSGRSTAQAVIGLSRCCDPEPWAAHRGSLQHTCHPPCAGSGIHPRAHDHARTCKHMDGVIRDWAQYCPLACQVVQRGCCLGGQAWAGLAGAAAPTRPPTTRGLEMDGQKPGLV